jgi:hypothetical protein
MPPTYSETHHLNVDDAGLASVHVAVHLQNVNPQIAHLLVLRVLDAASAVAAVPEQGVPGQVIRPQTSGPCVHCEDSAPYQCTYPYGDGICPHLDNPDIICPVKDACSAMQEIARMRDACEAEQEEQDADMAAQDTVYETETPAIADPGRLHTYVVEPEPEFPEPVPEEEPVYEASPLVGEMRLDARGWTPEQERAMCGATTPAEAVALYRAAYPGSVRTDAAIKSRYYQKIRPQRGATPAPDFAGDTVPVTQYDEPRSTGAPPYPWTGARVQIRSLPEFAGQIGTVVQYDPDSPEMLVALDNSFDRIWLPPESLVLVGAGRAS